MLFQFLQKQCSTYPFALVYLGEKACKTLNYNAQLKSCEALSQTKQEVGSEKITSANGWDYYEPAIYEVSYDACF